MESDIYALSKAGFSKERIEEITRRDDKEIQMRMLRKLHKARKLGFLDTT